MRFSQVGPNRVGRRAGHDPRRLDHHAGLAHPDPHSATGGRGLWQADTSYEPTADALFHQMRPSCYFLEYDTPRAGDFTPLRHLPPEPRICLGLVSTKERALEDADTLKRRIDEAARFIPLDRLSLSPQCGFSPGYTGHPLSHARNFGRAGRHG